MSAYPENVPLNALVVSNGQRFPDITDGTINYRSESGNTEPRAFLTFGNMGGLATAHAATGLTHYLLQILADQSSRLADSIARTLRESRGREEESDRVVSDIARKIELLGETGYIAASREAYALKPGSSSYENLLLAIATAEHKETEMVRAKLLRNLAMSSKGAGTRAAVRALGQMQSKEARDALREIAGHTENLESSKLANSYLK